MSDIVTFEICRPARDHAMLVMNWRNDPTTLAMSYHRDPKIWDSFWPEFRERYFSFSPFPVFALLGGKRIGFLKFEPVAHPLGMAGSCIDISINIAPEVRGGGVGTKVLRAVDEHVRGFGIHAIYAEVRLENAASQRTFVKAGYNPLGAIKKIVADTGESVEVMRFVRDLVPAFWRKGRIKIIAEAGSNWRVGTRQRDIVMARTLIDVAAEAEADIVKFQTYRPETTYVANAGESDYLSDAGIREPISDIFADLAMPYEMVGELAEYAASRGIGFMSTGFSVPDIEAIDPHVTIHKIASYESGHMRLLDHIANLGKPVIISTGASGPDDIEWAVRRFHKQGGRDLCLMQCTASYPAPMDSLNLAVIPWLQRRFGISSGLSDHSRDPVTAPVAAVGLGARCIEKHYTLHNDLPGPDHAFAITPEELKLMVQKIREAELSMGSGHKTILPAEDELAEFARRGVQTTLSVKKGDILREYDNIAILRPGQQPQGIHPRYIDEINGRRATRDIPAGAGVELGDWE